MSFCHFVRLHFVLFLTAGIIFRSFVFHFPVVRFPFSDRSFYIFRLPILFLLTARNFIPNGQIFIPNVRNLQKGLL